MRIFLIFLLVLSIGGCAWLGRTGNAIAPSQVDVNGNIIPGTHVATPIADDTAHAIPYGGFILSGMLLVWNFIEKVKANKTTAGLKSTVMAIENAGNDPSMAAAIAKLKVELSNAHQVAGIQPIINDILAKI